MALALNNLKSVDMPLNKPNRMDDEMENDPDPERPPPPKKGPQPYKTITC